MIATDWYVHGQALAEAERARGQTTMRTAPELARELVRLHFPTRLSRGPRGDRARLPAHLERHARRGRVKLTPIPVAPSGSHRSLAFVHRADGRGGLAEVETKDYPAPPHDLRAARLAGPHTLGSLGRALGVSAEVVSGLEWGRYSLTEPEWQHVLATTTRKDG